MIIYFSVTNSPIRAKVDAFLGSVLDSDPIAILETIGRSRTHAVKHRQDNYYYHFSLYIFSEVRLKSGVPTELETLSFVNAC